MAKTNLHTATSTKTNTLRGHLHHFDKTYSSFNIQVIHKVSNLTNTVNSWTLFTQDIFKSVRTKSTVVNIRIDGRIPFICFCPMVLMLSTGSLSQLEQKRATLSHQYFPMNSQNVCCEKAPSTSLYYNYQHAYLSSFMCNIWPYLFPNI